MQVALMFVNLVAVFLIQKEINPFPRVHGVIDDPIIRFLLSIIDCAKIINESINREQLYVYYKRVTTNITKVRSL